MRDQTPGQASDADSQTHVSAAPTSAGTLDGAWFRRERERIAVGRRAIAKHLQVAESRVVALETKGQQVPVPWLPLVAGLGFRLLPQLDSQPSQVTESAPATPQQAEPEPPKVVAEAPEVPLPAQKQDPVPQAAASDSAAPAVAVSPRAPEPAAAAPQYPASAESGSKPRMDGAWLQAERERLGLSRNTMRLHLNIHWATCARIEEQKLPIPKRYWRKLAELGFRLSGSAEAAPKAQKSSSPVSLRGSWLRRERKRLGLSHRELWQALKVHWRTVTTVEGSNRAIPAGWLPALKRLGMAVSGAPADARPAVAKTPPPAASPAVAPASPPAAKPAAKPADADSPGELLAMIVNYRLSLGRRSCQSAVETLGLIVQDLRTSNLNQAFTHDQLAQALDRLLQAKS